MIRVLKVGGSLFDLPNLGPRLEPLLASLSPAMNVLVAGGGAIADTVAVSQRPFGLSDAETHWLCIRSLAITSTLLSKVLPAARFTGELKQILEASSPSLWILEPEALLRDPRSHQVVHSLPQNATVTTDSIAAAVACALSAGELILVKSTDCDHSTTNSRSDRIGAAAQRGLVDPHFPLAAASIPKIAWCNLRSGPGVVWL